MAALRQNTTLLNLRNTSETLPAYALHGRAGTSGLRTVASDRYYMFFKVNEEEDVTLPQM